MVNQFVLIGRITDIKTMKNKTIVTLAIPRSYKNKEGYYETDFIKITTTKEIAKTIQEYCIIGDLISARGTIQTNNNKIIFKTYNVGFLSASNKEVNYD